MHHNVRIPAVEPPYEDQVGAFLDKWMPPGSGVEPLVLFRTLAVHFDLASRMRPLGAGILGSSVVAPFLREVMIHRTCARCGSEYEWGVHAVSFGTAVGLSAEQLSSTVHGDADDPCWDGPQQSVIRLADELHDTSRISDRLYTELSSWFGPQEILELTVTAGWYHTIAYVIGAADLAPEHWAATFPTADPRVS
jgi:alkylhydroperoxidase family enzyme